VDNCLKPPKRAVFQRIQDRKAYITNCQKCGDWLIIRQRKVSNCLDCQANACENNKETFSRFYRSGQWRQTRETVFNLKGRECVYCGKHARCVGHQTPISRGGSNHIENLQPICTTCNIAKDRKTDAEYKAYLIKYSPKTVQTLQSIKIE
jgi:5-methylcytosine-specific restriction endonuclease McrA